MLCGIEEETGSPSRRGVEGGVFELFEDIWMGIERDVLKVLECCQSKILER